jgi:hypothetical protein
LAPKIPLWFPYDHIKKWPFLEVQFREIRLSRISQTSKIGSSKAEMAISLFRTDQKIGSSQAEMAEFMTFLKETKI